MPVASNAPAAPVTRSHQRWLRRCAWALALLLGLWALAWLAVPPLLKQQGEKIASEKLGRKTTIGAVEFKPWTLELTLRDLAIASADGQREQLRIPRIYIDGELQSLLRLAPVVDAIEIDAPVLNLTHHGDGRYDVQDILERLAQEPSDPQAAPARFALYNLIVQGGAINFVDEQVGRTHTVRDLLLKVPFLSNLDSQRTVKVQPRLAFLLNDDPFDSSAEGTPFQDDHKTEVTLRLKSLDLVPYLGYLPRDLPLTLQAGTLDADLRLAFEAVAAAAQPLSLRVSGQLALSQVKAHDRQGQQLLAFDALQLELADVRPLEGMVQLQSLLLKAPTVHLRRDGEGGLNLARLATQQPQPSRASKTSSLSMPVKSAPAPAWNVQIGKLQVQEGHIDWRDESLAPPAQLQLVDVNLQAQELAWPARQPAPLSGSVRIQGPGQAAGEGAVVQFTGSGTDQAAQLAVTIDDVPLALAQPYLQAFLVPQLEGQLSAQLGVGWRAPALALQVAQARLESLALREGKTSLASLERLALSDTLIDLVQRRVQVGQLALVGPTAALERARDGRWVAERWLRTPSSPPGSVVAEPSSPPAPPWALQMSEFNVDGGKLSFKDASTAQPVALQIEQVQFKAKDLEPLAAQAKPAPVSLTARIGTGRGEPGRLEYQGTLGLAPLSAQGVVKALRLPLHALMPYAADRLNIDVRRAEASYQGQLHYLASADGPQLQLQGDAALEELRSHNMLALPPLPAEVAAAGGDSAPRGEPLLNWKSLNLRGLELALAPGQPLRAKVQETALRDFFARLVLFEDGQLNLSNLVRPAPGPASAEPAPASAPPQISVGPVALVNGRVAFFDRFIKPNYSIDISELTGRLGAFTSVAPQGAPQMAELELRGRAEGTAQLEVMGKLNPLAQPLALDIQAKLNDLELAPLSPYSVKYAGHGIERGKLNVDLAYKVQPDGQLSASNKIVLRQLAFGDPVPNAPTSLPVRLATALLSDSHGVIDLDLPVSGSLNDPQFRLAPVIFKALGNLIVKAVTAPFSLLAGGLGAGTDTLSQVPFEPASAQLTASARASLDKVAKALQERPALKLTVVGQASLEGEKEAMKQARLTRMLQAERRRAQGASAAPAQDEAAAANPPEKISDEEYPALLKAVYQRTDMAKPRNLVGLAKSLPEAEMQALLLANINLPDDAAQSLASSRAAAVRDYLVQQKLPLERLFLGAPKAAAPGTSSTPSAELTLSM